MRGIPKSNHKLILELQSCNGNFFQVRSSKIKVELTEYYYFRKSKRELICKSVVHSPRREVNWPRRLGKR